MRLGDYEVLRPIARGGMGAVFEVEHRGTHARYAAKVVKEAGDARARERFKREAELLARVDRHPGIVRIHSFGETPEGSLYMILDLVEGESLEQKLAREERLDPVEATRIARSVAAALAVAHERGVVHRDVKPSNILVDGASGEPRLGDFGIAAARDMERLTLTGAFVGSVAYASPEQARGIPCTPASDIFSLGAVLFEMLAGHGPILGATPHQVLAQLSDDAPVLDVRTFRPDAPADLARLVAHALEKDPARRPTDAASFQAELDAFLAGRAVKAPRRRRLRRVHFAVGALLVLLLVSLVAALAPGGEGRSEPTRPRMGALEAVARASAGTSDLETLLAARAALALARATEEPVSWETCAAGARAACALGAAEEASELSLLALERAPAERRDELRVLGARACLVGSGPAAALDELGDQGSRDAQRLRAHLLLVLRRWDELARLEPAEDPFAAGARALARGRRDGDLKHTRPAIERLGGDQSDLLAALSVLEARAETAALDSRTGGDGPALNGVLSLDRDTVLAPATRVLKLLEDARRAPRYVAAADVLDAADRALFYLQLSDNWNTFIVYPPELIEGLGKTVFAWVKEDDPRTVSLQARVEDMIGLVDGFVNERRRRFLETSLERSADGLEPENAQLLGRLYEIRFFRCQIGARAALGKVETLVGRLSEVRPALQDAYSGAWLGCLAGELAVRCVTVEPARRDELLERAAAHLSRARQLLPTSSDHSALDTDIALLAGKLAILRGDLQGARDEFSRAETLGATFLRGELQRLSGHPDLAEPLLERAALEANRRRDSLAGMSLRGDASIAYYLAELALGKKGSRETLAQLYGRRDAVPPLLPWIDRDARKAASGDGVPGDAPPGGR